MSSQRRINSSRANGAHSQGPATPEGLARSRDARLSHGLKSKRVLLSWESEDEFREFREACILELRPDTEIEHNLVEQYIAACWRLNRIWAMETAVLDVEAGRRESEIAREFQSCDDDVRAGLAFRALCDESRSFAIFERYQVHFTRVADRCLKALAQYRKDRPSPAPSTPSPANRKVNDGPSPANGHPAEQPPAPPRDHNCIAFPAVGDSAPSGLRASATLPPSPLPAASRLRVVSLPSHANVGGGGSGPVPRSIPLGRI